MRILKLVAVPVVALSLVACQGSGTKQTFGTLGGAAAGGLIGSQIGSGKGRVAAILAGVLIGGLIGNQIGKALDDQDREYARQASQRSLSYAPTGSTSAWRNPESGNSGNFRPTSGTYSGANGRRCRDFEHEIILQNGQREVVRGRACQNANGGWDTVS
ncbi:MAG: RT0821/Lpp0805 family surface protein [Alphaproteobacteria bacterium]